MNRLCSVGWMGIFLTIIGYSTYAQPGIKETKASVIEPLTLSITYNKTTNLIFPYSIKSVDRGSSAILVQKAKGVDNILQVKAAKKDFEQTNLSLVTTDGAFYSFLLNYASQPSGLNIRFNKCDIEYPAKITGQTSEAILDEEARQVRNALPFMYISKKQQLLQLSLKGIFFSENAIWWKLQLGNNAQIDFQPDYVRFFLKDKKRMKHTAIQETEIFPIHSNCTELIKGNSYSLLTIAFKPFTIPDHQRFIIQFGDESGGRTIELKIKSKAALKAKWLE